MAMQSLIAPMYIAAIDSNGVLVKLAKTTTEGMRQYLSERFAQEGLSCVILHALYSTLYF
jgi:hypothetical protein